MTTRKLAFGDRARDKLIRGVDKLDRAVGCTLGPGGRIVLIEDQFGKVIATKDGVTVARAAYWPDQHEYLGAQLLQEAALKVAEEHGDGTTTCVVIGAELLRQAHKLIGAGYDPMRVAAEIREAHRIAANAIMANSTAVDGDARFAALVAHVSGNGDQRVTEAVSQAFAYVGASGVILLREGTGQRVELSRQEGFHIPKGWPHAQLAPESGKIRLEHSLVLVVNRVIYQPHQLMPCLEHAAERGMGIVIVCENVVGDALETVTQNCRNNGLQAIVAKPPGFDSRLFDFMQDLAVWCGATVQDLYTGFEGAIDPSMMGLVEAAEQSAHATILYGAGGDERGGELARRIAALEMQRSHGTAYDRDKAVERIGRLRGRVATIDVGAPTEVEAAEVKFRVEDAIYAVRSAYRDGIQPGGGTALYRASLLLPETPGGRALSLAMRAPATRILRNAGTDPAVLLEQIERGAHWGMGCDAYGIPCSMLSLPDPTAVVMGSLQAAVSSASTLMTADAAVLLTPEE